MQFERTMNIKNFVFISIFIIFDRVTSDIIRNIFQINLYYIENHKISF